MISARSASTGRSIAIRVALAVAGSAVMAVAAHVAVPMLPVPITLQTLALPLIVLVIGRELGTLAMFAYLAEGAAGLPVFANVNTGPGLLGPSAGYLWMYPVAAYIIGTLCEHSAFGVTYVGRWFSIFAGTFVVFAGGVWWLMVGFNFSFAAALAAGVTPFVIGDVLKCTIAAGLAPQARKLFARLGA
jgi:biotin transport system substrate-specific component